VENRAIPLNNGMISQRNFYKTVYRMDDLMTSLFSPSRKRALVFCLLTLLVLMLGASGCTQSASQQKQQAPLPVTATQTDSTHIMITYPGSPDTINLLDHGQRGKNTDQISW
jgi:hypothetical protein